MTYSSLPFGDLGMVYITHKNGDFGDGLSLGLGIPTWTKFATKNFLAWPISEESSLHVLSPFSIYPSLVRFHIPTAMSLLNHTCPLCLNHLLKIWNMMKSMCWIVLNCFDVGYDCHWLMGELWTLNVLWWAPSSAEALYQFYQRRLAEAPELAFFAGFPHAREG